MGNEKINFSKKKLKKFFRSILLTGLRVKKAPIASFGTCG